MSGICHTVLLGRHQPPIVFYSLCESEGSHENAVSISICRRHNNARIVLNKGSRVDILWERSCCRPCLSKEQTSLGDGCGCLVPTSSCIPHSSSIVTQASIGKAISRPLIMRCSSRGFPKEGFSTQASGGGVSKKGVS